MIAPAVASPRSGDDGSSWASSPGVRRSMRANRRTDTALEVRVRSLLHRRGHRFRKDYRIDLETTRVRADIAFPRPRVAVFLDGCFWHRCPQHATSPKTNAAFWSQKLDRNVARDQRTGAALEAAGWTVLRFWEHENGDEIAVAVGATLDRLAREGA